MNSGERPSSDSTGRLARLRVKPLPSLAIVGRSEKMAKVLERARTIAGSPGCALLIGETGVGKELFADFIHGSSPRAHGPHVKIALSAMPHDLLESELFGHEQGAFTNAHQAKRGLFEFAHTGSLFLDDIDDVPLAIQSKLLRVLEAGEVLRIGSGAPIPIDVRVIASSKVDLKELVERGLFRADLYYRVNVFPVEIPPLRMRREDVPLLAEHFLRRFTRGETTHIEPSAAEALVRYDWPGNVRELRNVIQRVALFARSGIGIEDLPPEFREGPPRSATAEACMRCFDQGALPFGEVMACLESNLLREALRRSDGNRSRAAELLGLSPSTYRDKLKKHGLDG
jgi:DNA-binding NtrC family response regulator